MRDIDPALITRAQDGDLGARNEIVEKSMKLIRHIANQYAKPSYPADDLQSEGVLELIRILPLYDADQGGLHTFATRCIRNRFSVLLKQDRRFRARWKCGDVDTIPFEEEEGESPPFNAESAPSALRSLVEYLPDGQRLLVQLYYGLGRPKMSNDDLAALLGLNPSSVRMRVRAAMQSLRQMVEEKKIELPYEEIGK